MLRRLFNTDNHRPDHTTGDRTGAEPDLRTEILRRQLWLPTEQKRKGRDTEGTGLCRGRLQIRSLS